MTQTIDSPRYAVAPVEAEYWLPRSGRPRRTIFAVVDLATSTAHRGGNSWTIEATRDTRADAEALAASYNHAEKEGAA